MKCFFKLYQCSRSEIIKIGMKTILIHQQLERSQCQEEGGDMGNLKAKESRIGYIEIPIPEKYRC